MKMILVILTISPQCTSPLMLVRLHRNSSTRLFTANKYAVDGENRLSMTFNPCNAMIHR